VFGTLKKKKDLGTKTPHAMGGTVSFAAARDGASRCLSVIGYV